MSVSFIWFGFDQVLSMYESGAVASSGFNIPLWIRWVVVPIGGVLLGLQILVELIKDIYYFITGTNWEEVK